MATKLQPKNDAKEVLAEVDSTVSEVTGKSFSKLDRDYAMSALGINLVVGIAATLYPEQYPHKNLRYLH